MKLTLEELKILESELRVIDPDPNNELTDKQQERLFDIYSDLTSKLYNEIGRRENRRRDKKK